MKDFYEVIEYLRQELQTQEQRKIRDKDIAELLSISPAQFATLKKRNSMPYKQLLEYCYEKNNSFEKLFFH